jgi:hypothetical protein
MSKDKCVCVSRKSRDERARYTLNVLLIRQWHNSHGRDMGPDITAHGAALSFYPLADLPHRTLR